MANSYDAVIDRIIPVSWRKKVTDYAYGSVLEVGVGTGLNLSYYSAKCDKILGIDQGKEMLKHANNRKSLCNVAVHLEMMNIENMPLDSESFDTVLASFVFCNVPKPKQALMECYRVLKPGGRLILLEHMKSDKMILNKLMNWLNPITVKFLGDHINRDTLSLVDEVGFKKPIVENLFIDIVRLIVAER